MKKFLSVYVYIFAPFIALTLINVMLNDVSAIIESTDWSIASFMIYAQALSVISKTTLQIKSSDPDGLNIFIGITSIFMMISFSCYIFMNIEPSFYISLFQVFWFVVSSFWLFIISKLEDLLINKYKVKAD